MRTTALTVLTLVAVLVSACGGGGSSPSAPVTGSTSPGANPPTTSLPGGNPSVTPPASGDNPTPGSDPNATPTPVGSDPTPNPTLLTYTLGGAVSGLVGSGLVLQNNGGDSRAITGNGPFSFATALGNGAAYTATIATQPTNPTQQCVIGNDTGTIAGADVTNVTVVCAAPPSSTLASVFPDRLFAVHDAGDSRRLRAIASPGAPLADGLFIGISGGEQVFDGIFQSGLPDHTFELTTKTRKTLPAGTYSGEIVVELCKDELCAMPYPGAPVRVPYEVRVMSPTANLTPLNAVPNGKDWQTPHGGTAAHTGYVSLTLDSTKFTRRWKWLSQDPKVFSLSDVVSYQGRAFVTTNVASGIDRGGGYSAIGIDESTGQVAWVHPFERGSDLSLDFMDPPTVDNGQVYVPVAGTSVVSVFALKSTNGEQIWRSGFAGSGFIDAPTVSQSRLISHGGQSGGLVSFDAATGGTRLFSDGALDGVDFYFRGSVAADGAALYAVVPQTELSSQPVLGAYDPVTLARLYSIDTSSLPAGSQPISLRDPSPTPIITGANSVLIGYQYGADEVKKYRLEKFDTQHRSVSWFVDSDAVGSSLHDPVVANGIVYVANTPLNRLEARSESNGSLLWTWSPPTVDQSSFTDAARLIVTNNLLFAATDRFVYAISLSSHTEVWSHWNSGTLAMSANGVLYVKSSGTSIDAINLR